MLEMILKSLVSRRPEARCSQTCEVVRRREVNIKRNYLFPDICCNWPNLQFLSTCQSIVNRWVQDMLVGREEEIELRAVLVRAAIKLRYLDLSSIWMKFLTSNRK